MRIVEGKRIRIVDLVREWKGLCSIEKDVHVAISGDEGDGKSHLGVQITLNHFNGDIWDNVVYSKNPKELYEKYENLNGESPILTLDEALDLLDRLDWAKLTLKNLVKKFRGEVRKEKSAVFIYNVQLFRDLHGYWRNHRVRYWLELTPREWFKDVNFAFLLKRHRVPFITGRRDVWLLDEIEKEWMKAMSKGALNPEEYINKLREHPFYKGEFKFEELKPTLKKKYLKCRIEAKETYEKDKTELLSGGRRELMWKERYAKILDYIINKKKLMTQQQVADIIGIDRSNISLLFEWYDEFKVLKRSV